MIRKDFVNKPQQNVLVVIAACIIIMIIYSWYCYDQYRALHFISEKPSIRAKVENINQKVEKLENKTNGSDGLLDLDDFNHLLVPRNVCKSSEVRCVLLVTSHVENVAVRNILREAYTQDELLDLEISRVFLLARNGNIHPKVTQENLANENSMYGDLLQGSFNESYHNLTYKHAMGLKWASNLCPQIKYILKMDDDILVDLYKAVDLLRRYEKNNSPFDLLGLRFNRMLPIRYQPSKWFVSREEYARDFYPVYLSGWFYITKPKVAAEIVKAARALPYFWIDDVFLTGMASEILKLKILPINQLYTILPWLVDCCIARNMTCSHMVAPTMEVFNMQKRFQKHSKLHRTGHVSIKPILRE